jgi:hypothetical protein
MSDGCTNCGKKGGCDHRKGEMFAAMDEALARLYPTRRWGERAEPDGTQPGGVPTGLAARLADRLAERLKTLAVFLPGGQDETCDYIYVLCLGRTPSLLEVREGLAPPSALEQAAGDTVDERYLRVALSTVAPFAAVQQLALTATIGDGVALFEESLQAGVFDPVLLPRFRTLVAVLAELGLRHLDFGEMDEAPAGFDPGDYSERYGGAPALANYLFYPQPASSITTTVLALGSHEAPPQAGRPAWGPRATGIR